MIKVSNGAINETQIAAILKRGPNWEVVLNSGQGMVISEEDAKKLMPAEAENPKNM